MNTNTKLYFDNHPTVGTFYFTTDGQGFFRMPDAAAHGPNLEKKKKGDGAILCVTREQYNEWWADAAPKYAADAEAAVIAAEAEEQAAQDAVTALGSNATPSKKLAATNRLIAATAALTKANLVLEAANAEVALLSDTDELHKAEDKLETDEKDTATTDETKLTDIAALNTAKEKVKVDKVKARK